MEQSSFALKFSVVLMLLILFGGMLQFTRWRFDQGDVYQPYSSLRSDPLGTRIFFESLERLPDFEVTRNTMTLELFEPDSDTVLLLLGVDATALDGMPQKSVERLRRVATDGGRLVLALQPETKLPWYTESGRPAKRIEEAKEWAQEHPDGENEDAPEFQPPDDEEDDEEIDDEDKLPEAFDRLKEEVRKREMESFIGYASFFVALGLDVNFEPLPRGEEMFYLPVPVTTEVDDLPTSVGWRSGLTVVPFDPEQWDVIYSRDGEPVMLERALGKGTVLVSTDAFMFSNESMRDERQTEILAEVLAGKTRVVIEETHLNTESKRGVMALAREYGLRKVIFVLLALGGLFIWRGANSLVPPMEEEYQRRRGDSTIVRDATAGLVHMLRRKIPRKGLLPMCYELWEKSTPTQRADLAKKARRMEEELDRRGTKFSETETIETYRKMSQILGKRSTK